MIEPDLHIRTADALRRAANDVLNSHTPCRVNFEAEVQAMIRADKSDLRQLLSARFPVKAPALYAISLESVLDRQSIRERLATAKHEKIAERAYCRVLPFIDSECLYVGSSQTLVKRLLEHLGFGARSTYALQLAHWVGDLVGTLSIEALIYDDISANVLCALEEQLSAELKPMFGRRGSL